jgi:hypothetical protein
LGALPAAADVHLGLVRYGTKHLTRYNTMMFITTKREEFANDREVRAMLWIRDNYAGTNRHYDINNFPHPRPLTAPDPAPRKGVPTAEGRHLGADHRGRREPQGHAAAS